MDMHKNNELRPYQMEAIDKVVSELEHNSRFCIQMAPGTGKSRVILGVLDTCLKKHRTLLLVDRIYNGQYLYRSIKSEFGDSWPVFMVEGADVGRASEARVVISTVQKAPSLGSIVSEFDLIIAEEVHSSQPVLELYAPQEGAKYQEAKLVLISGLISKEDSSFFGEPIFKYDLLDAIEEGTLVPVEFISGPKANTKHFYDSEYVARLLEPIVKNLFSDPSRKAIIVCNSIFEAEMVDKACHQQPEVIRSVLIHSQINRVQKIIREFTQEDRFSVAVTVDMFTMLDSPRLTDIVLFRSIPSKALFNQVLSAVNRRFENKELGRVWDFSENKQHFQDGMGHLVVDQREVEGVVDEKTFEPDAPDIETEKESEPNEHDLVNSKEKRLANPCSDKPSKVDLLGRKGLVSILKGLIDRESRKHIIVALFGRWGSGKSSVIEMLDDSYRESSKNSFVVFNAWQAEHSNSMAASIANLLIDKLYESKGLAEQVILSLKARLLKSKTGILLDFTMTLLIAALGFGLIIPNFTDGLMPGTGTLISVSLFFSTMFPIVKAYLKHPFTGKIKELAKRPDFNAHIGLGHSIREHLYGFTMQ
jgi:superfamily II DNA or RNA helicase